MSNYGSYSLIRQRYHLSVLLLLEVTFVVLVGEIRHRRKWRLTGRRLQSHNAFTFTLKLRRNRQGKKANEGENVVLRFIKLKLRGALVASPLRLCDLSLLVWSVMSTEQCSRYSHRSHCLVNNSPGV